MIIPRPHVIAAGIVVALSPLALAPATATADPGAAAPDAVRVMATAHRGSSAYAPENTLAAFRLGIDQKSDSIESDVQRTKDGELVLMHDTTCPAPPMSRRSSPTASSGGSRTSRPACGPAGSLTDAAGRNIRATMLDDERFTHTGALGA